MTDSGATRKSTVPAVATAGLPPDELESISFTLHRYALATDEVDHAALASCFTPDAVLTVTAGGRRARAPITSREQITTHFIGSRKKQGWVERHLVTNVIAQPTREGADVTAYYLVTKVETSGAISNLLTGIYTFAMVRTEEGSWLIASENVEADIPVPFDIE